MARVSIIALALLASSATARATESKGNFESVVRVHHGRVLTQAGPSCPTGSAYDATLADCAVSCLGGFVRVDAANTTIGSTTVRGQCEPCPPGSFRVSGDANACAPCPVGTSNSRSGQISCVPCSYQGTAKYVNTTGAVRCFDCPAGTIQRTGETDAQGSTLFLGIELDQCVCEKGLYDPVVNRTGAPCESCPAGATCAGDTNRPMSRPLYYGFPEPHDDFFLRCPRMINNKSPCLGANACVDGFEQMSCSRCASGFYRFQRNCVKCPEDGGKSLIVAYLFLLVAFYVVKKLSTIVLPSMYIILTYIQCLSVVGNRQGWGTERTKTFLKATEIVNFPLDLFIPSCAKEMPFVHKAAVFTVTPIFYVLVDVILVEQFMRRVWPSVVDATAFLLVRVIRVKYVFGADRRRDTEMSEKNKADGARGALRHELGINSSISRSGILSGLAEAWYMRTPVEAEEALESEFGSKRKFTKIALKWAGKRVSIRLRKNESRSECAMEATKPLPNDAADPPLTFAQKCKKHFFEDMRLMYVATTGALLKSLRCTPVGDRDLSKFWISDAWFGDSVLTTDPAQKCWEGEHAKFVPYFVIMLVLYGVGYPLATLRVLNNAKNPNVRQGWHPKVYGKLYRRFEPEYYWWEIVYLIRRLCLVSFRLLMNDRRAEVYIARTMQGWQALCFILTICAALLAQFYAHPFKLEHMDLLDAALLCCLFAIIWLTMAFDYALKDTDEVKVLEGLVFLVVAVSVFISLYALLLDTYQSFAKNNKPVPRWIIWIVFTFTPPPMLVGLGLASKSTALQIEKLAGTIETQRDVIETAGGGAGGRAADQKGEENAGVQDSDSKAEKRNSSTRHLVNLQRKLGRLRKRAEDLDEEHEKNPASEKRDAKNRT